jgi:hypothetical protein
MPDRPGSERRRSPRIPVSWNARVSVDAASIVGRTVDVSEWGLFVATAPTMALRVGQSCRVELLAGTSNPFNVVAEIRHVSERGAGMVMQGPLPGWADLARGVR